MNDNMKQALDRQLSAVAWTAEDERRLRLRMQEAERPARRKLSAGLVLALIAMLMVTVAIATTQNGLLGLIQRMQYPDLSTDAQAYIQTDVAALATEDFTIAVPESYYDGRTLRMTVTVAPKEGSKLLYPSGRATNLWQELLHMDSSDVDPTDTRRVQDMFSAFEQAHSVAFQLRSDGDILQENDLINGYTSDFSFDPETCTLTFFLQVSFEGDLPQRAITLDMTIRQNKDGLLVSPQELSHTLTLAAVAEPELYECTEPALFAKARVRIDKLTLEVLPQDIYYTINYTVLDWEDSSYQTGKADIWFRFCKALPEEGAPIDLLSSGLHSLHNFRRVEGMQYVQTGTLVRSELHDTYYIFARDKDGTRYEANAFSVHPVSAE